MKQNLILMIRHSSESRSGLMVSALYSGMSGPGSIPDRGRCVVFSTLTVPLSTQWGGYM